jgi:flagellar basal-body rod modification protein FlgD
MSTTITGVNSTAAIPSSADTTGSTALGQDVFLRLLTTQLQNQDPTSPMSNEEFISQLAQFSQLEELQGVSESLDALYLVDSSMNNAAMTNLLGRTVVARGDTFNYSGEGESTIRYDAESTATTATLTITDEDGTVVWSGDIGALDEGEGSYVWDGTDTTGVQAGAGEYTFSITATDASGDTVTVESLVQGEIDQMSFEEGVAAPTVDGIPIDLGDIIRLTDE